MNLSAYMSSVRTYRWLGLYERLKATGLSFEMIIVGPNDPTDALPPEISFYKSDVKPAQCFQAALSMCRGDVLLQLVDDLEYEPGTLEAMHKVVADSDMLMSTAEYWDEARNYRLYQNIAGEVHPGLPLLPVCGMYSQKAHLSVGGLDRRFDGVMCELDMYMRLRINGYQTVFVPGRVIEKTSLMSEHNEGVRLCTRYWNKDRECFKRLWMNEQGWLTCRNDILRPYSMENILTVNQTYDY